MIFQTFELTFRKESKYRTEIGGIASIIFGTVMCMLIGMKTLELTSLENATIYMSNSMLKDTGWDLFERNFRFALVDLDKELGEFKAYEVKRYTFRGNNKREKTPIELIDCNELRSNSNWTEFFNKQVI